MKRILLGLFTVLCTLAAQAATLVPVQLLNPSGSTSGQALLSTGPSSAPGWGSISAGALAPITSNTVLGNSSAASAAPSALIMPTCSGSNNALLWTTNTGFTCGASRALTTGDLSQFASTTSAQLRGVISDETGSGSLVFGTSPTLTTPVISSIVNTGTLTLPTSTDTLVGRATTDTLTNKTLTSPAINGAVLSGTLSGTPTFSGIVTFSSAITPSQTAGITATNTNNSANTGSVGEFVCAQVTNGGSPTGCATNSSTPVSLTSNTPANVTSVSLGAGEWKCTANVVFNNGGTTVTTQSTGSISTTSATMDTLQFGNYSPPNTAGLNPAFAVPARRLLLSGTTTVYLVANNVFATSTSAVYGRIECQRPR